MREDLCFVIPVASSTGRMLLGKLVNAQSESYWAPYGIQMLAHETPEDAAIRTTKFLGGLDPKDDVTALGIIYDGPSEGHHFIVDIEKEFVPPVNELYTDYVWNHWQELPAPLSSNFSDLLRSHKRMERAGSSPRFDA